MSFALLISTSTFLLLPERRTTRMVKRGGWHIVEVLI